MRRFCSLSHTTRVPTRCFLWKNRVLDSAALLKTSWVSGGRWSQDFVLMAASLSLPSTAGQESTLVHLLARHVQLGSEPLWGLTVSTVVVMSQSLTVLSSEEDARVLPSGEKATPLTCKLCPLRVNKASWAFGSHTFTRLSWLVEASRVLSDENSRLSTHRVCALIVPFS
eukprot:CAMPEP_0114134936 /NCGR_PEP_ID=MMETSP0043_2-20121206/14436_1 /TAXON_ID=464988 /ORGANISM="Hemiselmis andersenii, Strain CCMP644" /LENGTH=169 /DNA_ID=CAMNT_0001228635 /DNA_START=127 /DNA_END=632 /DNA_ORIENTATION=-